LGAGALFDNGKFQDAEEAFQKFLQQYPDYPMASQAELGVAASLEAQGKTADAVSRYKDFRDRHPQDSRQLQDPAVVQASVALARLYVVQGKPDSASRVYEDILKNGRGDSWTEEAEVERDQLLAKYPELRPKPPAAPAPVTPSALKMNPTPAPSSAPVVSTPVPSPKQTGAVPLTITN
jgi:outer membrane protein assembly factor BamD (BamD/ComL family)